MTGYLACRITATGVALPRIAVRNGDLIRTHGLDSSDEWIRERTGIHQRYIAQADENTATLATSACREALERGGVCPSDIDMIVCATTTPTYTFPSVAVMVQGDLACRPIPAIDVHAACAGFIHALGLGYHMLRSNNSMRNVLIVGAETMSRTLDWTDRKTCILFGDGAGAIVLQRWGAAASSGSGILGCNAYSDGRHVEKLYVSGGVSLASGVRGVVRMNGPEVFRYAVELMAQSMQNLLDETNTPLGEVDWFIPHQANWRILSAIRRKMGIDAKKMVSTIHAHANTSAASIPLALDAFVRSGRIRRGQLLMLSSMGSGFTWGSALIRF